MDHHERVVAVVRPVQVPGTCDQLAGDREHERRLESFGVLRFQRQQHSERDGDERGRARSTVTQVETQATRDRRVCDGSVIWRPPRRRRHDPVACSP